MPTPVPMPVPMPLHMALPTPIPTPVPTPIPMLALMFMCVFACLPLCKVILRGLLALVEEEETDATHAALRDWLPPPTELLRITEFEIGFRGQCFGGSHPALVIARLHGERLGNWEATVQVTVGVLAIEALNPVLRVEAYRLLARANATLGRKRAACEAAENAAATAVQAHYVFYEILSLRDVLKWTDASEVQAVCARLRAAAERTTASRADLERVLGTGVL